MGGLGVVNAASSFSPGLVAIACIASGQGSTRAHPVQPLEVPSAQAVRIVHESSCCSHSVRADKGAKKQIRCWSSESHGLGQRMDKVRWRVLKYNEREPTTTTYVKGNE